MMERPVDRPGEAHRDPAGFTAPARATSTRIDIEKKSTDDDAGKDARSQLADKARDTKAAVRDAAHDTKDAIEERAEEQAERTMTAASRRADGFARALRHAGEALQDEGEEELARYGRETAERVENFAGYLDRRDVAGLVHDLEDTARRSPAVFVGSTFAAGLLLGRFLRSSSPEPDPESRAGERRSRPGDASESMEGPGTRTREDLR